MTTHPAGKNIYTTIFIISFLLLVFSLCSCISTPTPPLEEEAIKTIPFSNTEYTIHLEYPADWFFKDNEGLFFATVSSFDIEKDGGAGLAILRYPVKDLMTEFKNMTPPDLIQAFLSEINAEFQETDTISFKNWEAQKADFTISGEKESEEESLVAGEILIYQYKDYIYVFMAITKPAELMKEYAQTFHTMYESIEFLQEAK
jgi:hypothetical protein